MNLTRLIVSFLLFIGSLNMVYGQCVPDTMGCKDEGTPGEFCPLALPVATVNVAYDEVITVIPPGEAKIGETTIIIKYIIVDSVLNLPSGMTYAANAEIFYADTAYCIALSGIPVNAGTDTLAIYVTPFISVGTTAIPGPQVVDDTSVVIIVQEASGIKPSHYSTFQVLPNIPNPFSDVTRIGFFTPFDDLVELRVFNILGEMIHQETQGFSPGEHYFEFNGQALQPGTYIYRITNREAFFTGKFIKARK
jgi:Secretion system C-terminal sorting domain